MSIGIYKIENLINHKIYIGQSVHIEKRWQQHCQKTSKSSIGQAIQKYGKENFSFQILVECDITQLDEMECKYIQKYNSLAPNGYNLILTSPIKTTCFNKYTYDYLLAIIKDLKESNLSINDIAKKYQLDKSMIYYINRGDYHTLPNETYPIRAVRVKREINYCCDCNKKISFSAKRCATCSHKIMYKTKHPDRNTLKNLIRHQSFVSIGKQYGVSNSAVVKWCIKYNLPSKKSIIKAISENDWEKI